MKKYFINNDVTLDDVIFCKLTEKNAIDYGLSFALFELGTKFKHIADSFSKIKDKKSQIYTNNCHIALHSLFSSIDDLLLEFNDNKDFRNSDFYEKLKHFDSNIYKNGFTENSEELPSYFFDLMNEIVKQAKDYKAEQGEWILTSKIQESALFDPVVFDNFLFHNEKTILSEIKREIVEQKNKGTYPTVEDLLDLVLKETAYDFIEQLGDEIHGEEHNLYGKIKDVIDELFDEFSLDEIKQMVVGTFLEEDIIDIEDENELKDILTSAYYEDLSLSYLNDTRTFLEHPISVSIANNHINETESDFTALEYLKPDVVNLLTNLIQGFSSDEEKEVFKDSLKAVSDGLMLSDYKHKNLVNQNGLLHFLNAHDITEKDFNNLLHSNETICDEKKDFVKNILKELESLEDDVGLKTSFVYLTKMSNLDFAKTILLNKLYLQEQDLPFNIIKDLENLNLSISIQPNTYCGLVSNVYDKLSSFELKTEQEIKIPLIYAHLSQEDFNNSYNFLRKPLMDLNFGIISKLSTLSIDKFAGIAKEKTSLDYDLKEKLHHKIKQQSRMQNLNIQLKS